MPRLFEPRQSIVLNGYVVPHDLIAYAPRRGCMTMSRTWASTLESCMVFSLRGELHQFGDERIGQQFRDLVFARRTARAQQIGHAHFQRLRQAASDDSVGVAFSFSIFET